MMKLNGGVTDQKPPKWAYRTERMNVLPDPIVEVSSDEDYAK